KRQRDRQKVSRLNLHFEFSFHGFSHISMRPSDLLSSRAARADSSQPTRPPPAAPESRRRSPRPSRRLRTGNLRSGATARRPAPSRSPFRSRPASSPPSTAFAARRSPAPPAPFALRFHACAARRRKRSRRKAPPPRAITPAIRRLRSAPPHPRGIKRRGDQGRHRPQIGERQALFDRSDFAPHRLRNAQRIAGRAHVERHSGFVVLSDWMVSDRPEVFAEGAIFAVARDAYDFAPRSVRSAEAQTPAERILAVEVLPRESFIDDHHARRAFVVPRGEIAASRERDAHRLKIFRSDDVHPDDL